VHQKRNFSLFVNNAIFKFTNYVSKNETFYKLKFVGTTLVWRNKIEYNNNFKMIIEIINFHNKLS